MMRTIVSIALCLSIFVGLLWSGFASGVGFYLRYDTLFIPIIFGMIFIFLAKMRLQLAAQVLCMLSVTINGLVLSGIWREALSDFSVMVGLFPINDSSSYLKDAIRLMYGNELSGFSSRRPLSSGFFALLLYIFNGNIKFTLAALVFLGSISIVFPTKEVARSHGWIAAYVVFVSLLLFYQRIVGTALHEHLGLSLGCIGFAYIWRSAFFRQSKLAVAGIFLISLALNARAGAFFILPLLAVWSGYMWRNHSRFSLKVMIFSFIAVSGGFIVNATVLYFTAQPSANQGNFSYIIYGLTHEGDWSHVYDDIPNLDSLSEQERNNAIYGLALKEFKENPFGIVKGVLKTYKYFFFSKEGAYSFVNFALQKSFIQFPGKPSLRNIYSEQGISGTLEELYANIMKYIHIFTTLFIFVVLSVLAVIGVLSLSRLKTSTNSLLAWAGIGILVSVPFAPPWHADQMRAYAATLPFMCALSAMGAVYIKSFLIKNAEFESPGVSESISSGTGLCLFISIVVIAIGIAPIIIRFHPIERTENKSLGFLYRLKIIPGSVVILNNDQFNMDWGRNVSLSKTHRNVGVFASSEADSNELLEVLAFEKGDVLAMGIEDSEFKSVRYLVMDRNQVEKCGTSWFFAKLQPLIAGNNDGRWWRVSSLKSELSNISPTISDDFVVLK